MSKREYLLNEITSQIHNKVKSALSFKNVYQIVSQKF